VVFIEEAQSSDNVIGTIQNVEITDRDVYDLYAKRII